LVSLIHLSQSFRLLLNDFSLAISINSQFESAINLVLSRIINNTKKKCRRNYLTFH
uniref:Ovule protein n=1 Tax=Brugia timori TaxID=42155 RepID=A0A0R3R459_9BILA